MAVKQISAVLRPAGAKSGYQEVRIWALKDLIKEQRALLDECEKVLEMVLPDQFYRRQAVVDVLTKLRAREKDT